MSAEEEQQMDTEEDHQATENGDEGEGDEGGEAPRKRVRKKRVWDSGPAKPAAAAVAAVAAAATAGTVPLPATSAVTTTPTPAAPAQALPTLTPEQTIKLQKAQHFALQQSINFRQSALQLPQMNSLEDMKAQQEKAAKDKAVALMSRVYVGSIGFDTSHEDLLRSFTPYGFITMLKFAWDPLVQKHKGYCFIEYETPEAATLAIDANQALVINGRTVKVGRPTNAVQAAAVMEQLQKEAVQQHQIYVASIHPDLSEEDIQSVFEPFGNVLECRLAPDSAQPGKHRGYGFIKFDNEDSAKEAVAAMNMFDLGGQFLRVCRTMVPPDAFQAVAGDATQVTDLAGTVLPHVQQAKALAAMGAAGQMPGALAAAAAAAAAMAPPSAAALADSTASLRHEEDMHISGSSQRFEIMRKLQQRDKVQSKVIVLRNMVTAEDVDENLEEEVKTECSKFGPVDRVVIYQDKGAADPVIKIFVAFTNNNSAEAAEKSLHQRWFGGRVIVAEQYSEDKFKARDYSG